MHLLRIQACRARCGTPAVWTKLASLISGLTRSALRKSRWRSPSRPASARLPRGITGEVIRILNNGEATILAYEMPEAIFIGRHSAAVLPRRNFTLEREVISESNLFLEPGEGLLLFSDGITLAGIGGKTRLGWNINEICRFVNDSLVAGEKRKSFISAFISRLASSGERHVVTTARFSVPSAARAKW